jgi:hypothetical protein
LSITEEGSPGEQVMGHRRGPFEAGAKLGIEIQGDGRQGQVLSAEEAVVNGNGSIGEEPVEE